MKLILSIAFLLFATTAQSATVQAAQIDVPRIVGIAVVPTSTGELVMPIDLEASAATCVAKAAEWTAGWQENESNHAATLNKTDYALKTNLVCNHRWVTVPDTSVRTGPCSETISDTMTFEEVFELCPILQQLQ